jgi:hypothetical protein
MFTHRTYMNRGINMPYYMALDAGYITWDEYCDLKKMPRSKDPLPFKRPRVMTPLEEELGGFIG